MNETKHTPGPWVAQQGGDKSRIWGRGTQELNYLVAVVEREPVDTDGTHIANAQLISAATEMLEVCEAIVALADGQGWANLLEVAGQARIVLAKAKGK